MRDSKKLRRNKCGSPKSVAALRHRGMSLLELLAGLTVMLIVGGAVIQGMFSVVKTQGTISNRTEMHASVRSATELIEQELTQAGRVTLGAQPMFLGAAITTIASPAGIQSVLLSEGGVTDFTTVVFVGELLTVDTGTNRETVAVTGVTSTTMSAVFNFTHISGAPVVVMGGFANGVIPNGIANGSDGFNLKIFGDINGDGNMVYIKYHCDNQSGGHNALYRDVTSGPLTADATHVTSDSASTILLENVEQNPNNGPCFTYQTQTAGTFTFVTNVAVTLTVQTQNPDPQTGQYQKETKALLNVAPRNVFEAWELAYSNDYINRVQPIPLNIQSVVAAQ